MEKEILKTIILEFQERNLPQLLSREQIIKSSKEKLSCLVGMRRSGKTSLLFNKIKSLLKANVDQSQILYVNFEDDRLPSREAKIVSDFLEVFYSIFPDNHEKKIYLFFDEIQEIADWEKPLRRILDTKLSEIYITGSSSKMLSKEIATSMRGRTLLTEVWPFSFKEFLIARGYSLPKSGALGPKVLAKTKLHLQEYLVTGGFPEVVLRDRQYAVDILRDYKETIVFRDLVERHSIENINVVRQLINFLLKNASGRLSVNKLFNDLKSQGLKLSKNTLYDYISYLEDCYFVFTATLFTESLRKQNVNYRKIYSIDTGMVKALTLSREVNWGQLFENLFFHELRKKENILCYYLTKSGAEVDFVVTSPNRNARLYQVCWDIDESQTHQRELKTLGEAEKELGIKGKIITPENYIENICSGKMFEY